MEPFIGQLMLFGGNFPPRGWAQCDGALISIAQNSALFSILGTTYGGDGRTTFGLPDLRGRVPVHHGNGPGLSSYNLGSKGGTETVTLTTAQMPSHAHGVACSEGQGDQAVPAGHVPAPSRSADDIYGSAKNKQMDSGMITNTGGSQAHENRMPYQTLNWCIALVGVFPSRN
ncbi:MAG: tail fiber protein [Planctomycetota bacterium]|nr:tail fiber protein [Planctomycetota bacterium]